MLQYRKMNIKKYISLVLSITLILLMFPVYAFANVDGNDKLYGETMSSRNMTVGDCPSISAQYACLMSKDGTMIYERNAYAGAKIASMTKIMTAIIALEEANLDDRLEINDQAVKIGESSAGFWVGDKLDMKSALYALMVPSGNDAAEAICEFVGKKAIDNQDDRIRKKSVDEVKQEAKDNNCSEEDIEDVYISNNDEAFVKLMNTKAEILGCTNTCFTNPHGLDDDEYKNDNQHSCAADMAVITRYAMQNDLFRQIVSGGDTSITVERNGAPTELKLTSTDILLNGYHGAMGVKTGHTDTAGACFSGAVTDDSGVELYSIVMHSENEAQRFVDTQKLWEWYYNNKVDYKLANSDDKQEMTVGDHTRKVNVVAYIAHSEWCDCSFPVTTEDPDQTIPVLTIAGNVYITIGPSQAHGSFKAGDKVAEAVYTQHNKEIARINLVAIKDQPGPNIFQMIGVGFDRIYRSLSGQSTVAETKIISNQDAIKKVV